MHSDIHDPSTFVGRVHLVIYRWKYTVIAFAAAAAIGVVYVILNAESLLNLSPVEDTNLTKFLVSSGDFKYHGNSSKFETRHLDIFPGLNALLAQVNEDPTTITSIEIKWVKILASNFSQDLILFTNLVDLRLDNVTFEGLLQPAKLPKLQKLFISQGVEPEDKTDYRVYAEPTPWLQSTLFFLNTKNSSGDFYTQLANQHLDYLAIWLKGSITYVIDKTHQDLRISLPRCKPILEKINFVYTRLTLGLCSDLTPTSISPNVKYINFYITYTSTEILSQIIRNLPNLEKFFAEIPGGKSITLSDFSPKLQVLSVSSMRINIEQGVVMRNVKEFYFGSENQYGFINETTMETDLNTNIVHNFSSVFPVVEKVGIFDLEYPERYIYLQNVIVSSAKFIVCEGFPRNDTEELTGIAKVMEEWLFGLGIPREEENFQIEKTSTGGLYGRSLSNDEKLTYRYRLLGWDAIDSFPKFYYVQTIIEAGGILGLTKIAQGNYNVIINT